MVMQFLHQTNLCFLLHRLVRRTVLTYTEGVVAPDELNRQLHKCRHTNSRFHIIAEHKERTTCRDDTAVQRHTDTYARHRELTHARLQELTAEITLLQRMGLLQETVRLIGVREVSRRNDHITYILSEEGQHLTARITGSVTRFLLNQAPIHTRCLAAHEGLIFSCILRISLCPLVVSGVFLIRYLAQLNSALFV